MKAFVYVISGEHGRQKIGCSDNPKQRIRELQTGSPYPLKFEFIGEAEGRSGGQIEVEAHFMLNEHKSQGGDEWFTVPPDVAVTAVMVAAHRLGYRLRPIDPNAAPDQIFSGQKWPTWVYVAMSPIYVAFLYWIFVIAHDRMTSGEMPMGAFAIEAAVLFGLIWLVQMAVFTTGRRIIAWVS